MSSSNQSVDGTISINVSKTRQSDDVVFNVRTSDGTDINVATSKVATKQLKNSIESIVID